MMPTRCAALPTWALVVCLFSVGARRCAASPKNSTCSVQDGRADCSHLSLGAIPADLPEDIVSLDMSHNRLLSVDPASLARYRGLLALNVNHNSITKLTGDLCGTLPLLQTLHLGHNEVHLLKEEDLRRCGGLTWLSMASNRLKLKGEPFTALQSLKFLDVSANKLQSARLGSAPQLPSLLSLNLAFNDFTELKRDDFSFLNQSLALQVLNLSATSLKTLEPGCFEPVSGLRSFIFDLSNVATQVLPRLCAELSETAIESLSLQKIKLVSLTNTTFEGLQKTNLTLLDLSSNGLGRIEENSFRWLPRLQTLILSDNNIKHVTRDTFQGLKALKRLYLTKALVKSASSSTPIIDDFSFQPLSALETLILRNTAVREITENTFTGLTSLTELDLSFTSYESLRVITSKTFASLSESPLLKLNLTRASVKHLEAGSFSVLGNLTTLLLDFNFINQNLTGQEFTGLSRVQELHMTNNLQSMNLNSETFVNMTSLRVLTLGRSLRAMALNVDPSPFRTLSDLAVLDLSNNNIANLRGNLLEGLSNLKMLRLEHNNLARLWKSANLGGPVLFLKETRKLTSLRLDYNGLDEIPVDALRGLADLRELSLSNNLLNNLRDSVFDDLRSLRVLKVEKNLITAVRPEVFQTPMGNLSLLVMDKNPFDCTCESIMWFVTWLNSTNGTSVPGLSDQYVCNTPLTYFNSPIVDFDTSSCKDMAPFQALYILSSTAVLMLMVTALLVRFHGWRVQFYWNILINRTLGFSDAKVEEGRQFAYDAYVIHAAADASWVERRMAPLENERCRFFLEDRDSIPGVPQLESIVSNMRKCRKILFVVTESLLNDRWCRQFKVHHALNQVIEASRDSIVLVFLQDVHDYKLSRSLFLRRGMLRPCCILDWPVYKERVPAFHQKLLIALGMTNRLQE